MISRILDQHGAARLITALVLIVGMLFVGTGLTAQARSEQDKSKKELVGTWRMKITPYDCATGAERPTFRSMLSFEEGGTLTEAALSPAFQPGQRGPGHGIWNATGDHTYNVVFEAFILFTTEPNPPAPGFQMGVQRVTTTIEVNGDQSSGPASVEFFDVGGNLVSSACTKAVGERME
jgi:hypothetical protein